MSSSSNPPPGNPSDNPYLTPQYLGSEWAATTTPAQLATWLAGLPDFFLRLLGQQQRYMWQDWLDAGESLLPKLPQQERRRLHMMMQELREHQQKLQHLWGQHLTTLIQDSWQLLQSPVGVDLTSLSLETMNLGLVEDQVMQEEVSAARLANAVEGYLRAIVSSYRGRLATILQREEVSPDSDPFRPLLFFRGLLQATLVLGWGETHWQLLARVFTEAYEVLHGRALHTIYAEFDRELEAQGWVSQRDLFRVAESPAARAEVLGALNQELLQANTLVGAATAVGSLDTASLQPDAPLTLPRVNMNDHSEANQTLQQAILKALQTHTMAFADTRTGGLPALGFDPSQGPVLKALLNDVLDNFPPTALAQLNSTVAYGASQTMALLYDYLAAVPGLCQPVRDLFYLLQFPLLQVALSDPDFLTHDHHVARQLMNQLGEIGLALLAGEFAEDTTLQHLQEGLTELAIQVLETEAVLVRLRQAQGLVDAWQQVKKIRIQQRLQQVTQIIAEDEKQLAAHKVAQAELELLIQRLPCPLRLAAFLREYWVVFVRGQIVGFGLAREDKWRRAVHSAEMVLWSVQPKYTYDERKVLANELPEMLRRFSRGLDAISYTGALRQELLQWLEQEHMRALRGQPVAAEEVAQPIAHFLPDSTLRQREIADRDAWLATLHLGSWYEVLHEDGQLERMTLAWISEGHTRLYLASRQGLQGMLLTPSEFAHKLQHGAARLLAEGTLIERAADNLFIQLNEIRRLQLNGQPASTKQLIPPPMPTQSVDILLDIDPWQDIA
ncbi:DUF1631 family protein [Parvibium lacunae]|uniref:DUF1631 family protein n=1 Tax=Parvibium lacunae TaxID=1888893 RepID=A0A368L539_9BURK|nr:DUF1631 family protein [Parvibium lacunae]RCS58542.1 DUF1631 family protein [Parvibium lacunae]